MGERDVSVDIIRGVAAIIVILGHSYQQFMGYDNLFFFNVIFSLQMPIFMFISGYCNLFTKRITNGKQFKQYILKKSGMLLLPWLSWSIIACVFVNEWNDLFEYIKTTAFHMESAFWFLFSLWTISMMFGSAEFVSNIFSNQNSYFKFVIYCIIYIFYMAILGLIGIKVGMTFLAIKYTLYYSLFYNAGILFGMIRISPKWKVYIKTRNIILFFSSLFYLYSVYTFNVYKMEDTLINIGLRAFIGLVGCYLMFEIIERVFLEKNCILVFLQKIGMLSLELYCVHWTIVFMHIFEAKDLSCQGIVGFCLLCIYSTTVLLFSLLIVQLININPLAKFIMFGKR